MKFFSIISLFLLQMSSIFAESSRHEISAYALMKDHTEIERQLANDTRFNFFSFSNVMTSKTLSLFTQVQNKTSSGDLTSQTAALLEILNQNLNKHYFTDVKTHFGLPIPKKFLKKSWEASLYFDFSIGLSFSIDNHIDQTDPTTQIYLKKDTEIGFSNKVIREQKTFLLEIYYLIRNDEYSQMSTSNLATEKQIFSLNNLIEKNQKSLNINVGYSYEINQWKFLGEIKEIALTKIGDSTESQFGNRPLAHLQAKTTFKKEKFDFDTMIGLIQRRPYSLMHGLYAGIHWRSNIFNQIHLIGKLSVLDILLTAQIQLKKFYFSYGYKTPFYTSNNGIKETNTHELNINFSF